ncbi:MULTISPECIES: hypothetical protein [Pseudomonas syringae group]|uniref:hypothetical protein n=1 Tax=Pseudomonas syringae group TaxID=136849 RepID=UPI000AB2FDE3|nr:hypothetical protein [Pseudomonas syringae group genomosp. 3]
MNPHFTLQNDQTELPPIPRAGYARIDDVEMSRGRHYARVSFDLVDADWLDNCLASDHKNIEENPLDFEKMPLFHLEVVLKLSAHGQPFRFPSKSSRPYQAPKLRSLMVEDSQPDWWGRYPYDWKESVFDSSMWFFIEQTKKWKGHRADIYRNMSDDAKSINVEIQRFTSKKLDQIFTLPGTVVNKLGASEQALLNDVTCDRVIIFDVGQGNANGMVRDASDAPELYFDVGAGVYRNQRTRPSTIHLPAHNVKAVILSHWDGDHWAGANIPGNDALLSKTWIAPNQVVGPRHVVFAHRIIKNKGKLLLLAGMSPQIHTAPIQGGRVLQLTQGTGHDRNDGGLVASVEITAPANQRRSILLTGDCDYCHFSHLITAPVIGLVAPHHGAALKSNHTHMPSRANNQSKLAYSFGPNNAHGKFHVRHPTAEGVALHNAWHHGSWRPTRPGFGNPGPYVVATSDHTPGGARGDVYLDW